MVVGGAGFSVDLGTVAFLAVAAGLAAVYGLRKAIVVLPGLMLAALLARTAGLPGFQPLFAFSSLATALLVFIAGLELDVRLLGKEKERVLLLFFFEMLILLSMLNVLRALLDLPLALALTAVMLASNEAFVLEAARGSAELGQFGITISVLEDSAAVFLLSVGFFTSKGAVLSGPELYDLLVRAMLLLGLALALGGAFNGVLRRTDSVDAGVLVMLVYVLLMSSAAGLAGLPEALVLFLGGVGLAVRGVPERTAEAMRGYMTLALMGFVLYLPYRLPPPSPGEALGAAALGAAMALAAFALRGTVLWVSSLLAGLDLRSSTTLALSLANTGEFGLLVVSTLAEEGMIGTQVALAAMFAYAINLTLVSAVVRRIDAARNLVLAAIPDPLEERIDDLTRDIDRFVVSALKDEKFKGHLYEMAAVAAVVYLITAAMEALQNPITNYAFSVVLLGAFVLTVYTALERMSRDLEVVGSSPYSLISMAIRFSVLYVVMAPLLHSLQRALSGGLLVSMSHPMTLFLVFATAAGLDRGLDRLSALAASRGRTQAGRAGPGEARPGVRADRLGGPPS